MPRIVECVPNFSEGRWPAKSTKTKKVSESWIPLQFGHSGPCLAFTSMRRSLPVVEKASKSTRF